MIFSNLLVYQAGYLFWIYAMFLGLSTHKTWTPFLRNRKARPEPWSVNVSLLPNIKLVIEWTIKMDYTYLYIINLHFSPKKSCTSFIFFLLFFWTSDLSNYMLQPLHFLDYSVHQPPNSRAWGLWLAPLSLRCCSGRPLCVFGSWAVVCALLAEVPFWTVRLKQWEPGTPRDLNMAISCVHFPWFRKIMIYMMDHWMIPPGVGWTLSHAAHHVFFSGKCQLIQTECL